jgi:hypothetical protein
MEHEFSVENRFFRSCAGTAMVGHAIRVKGDVMLKILKDREVNGTSNALCFHNASKVLEKVPGATYVEGFAFLQGCIFT